MKDKLKFIISILVIVSLLLSITRKVKADVVYKNPPIFGSFSMMKAGFNITFPNVNYTDDMAYLYNNDYPYAGAVTWQAIPYLPNEIIYNKGTNTFLLYQNGEWGRIETQSYMKQVVPYLINNAPTEAFVNAYGFDWKGGGWLGNFDYTKGHFANFPYYDLPGVTDEELIERFNSGDWGYGTKGGNQYNHEVGKVKNLYLSYNGEFNSDSSTIINYNGSALGGIVSNAFQDLNYYLNFEFEKDSNIAYVTEFVTPSFIVKLKDSSGNVLTSKTIKGIDVRNIELRNIEYSENKMNVKALLLADTSKIYKALKPRIENYLSSNDFQSVVNKYTKGSALSWDDKNISVGSEGFSFSVPTLNNPNYNISIEYGDIDFYLRCFDSNGDFGDIVICNANLSNNNYNISYINSSNGLEYYMDSILDQETSEIVGDVSMDDVYEDTPTTNNNTITNNYNNPYASIDGNGVSIDYPSTIDLFKKGFGLLGDDGLIALIGQFFSFIPAQWIMLYTMGLTAMIGIAIIKFLRG